MEKPVENYWRIRLTDLKKVLKENGFEVFLADNAAGAKEIVQGRIIPDTGAKSISWGGSMTFRATGLYESIKDNPNFEVLDVFDKSMTPEATLELRRRSLLVDLFMTGSNAITESGALVNLDMYGNRVAGITFGPKYVVIFLGRNKIVRDLDDAFLRIKNYVAPVNAMRLDKKVPCVKTSFCDECKSSERICNTWTITEKSFPKGRIKIVLINQDLGL
jgi:L-lactate utilization protein LutB